VRDRSSVAVPSPLSSDKIHRSAFPPAGLLFLCFVALIGWISGCKSPEKPLPPAKIHAVTREFAAAAKSAAPADAQVRTEFRAADGTDHLEVTILSRNGDAGARAAAFRVLQSLNSVAVSSGLMQDEPAESRDGWRVVFRHGGVATHTLQVDFAAKSAGAPGGAAKHEGTTGQAKLAILLDDLGSDRDAAEQIFALPYPLTISVLPEHAHSVEIAEEAHRRGYEVMLHLPMQSVGKEQPEKQELRPGMPEAQVSALVGQFLSEVPGVDGVNNHQGSQATADPALMGELMHELHARHVFYVDSRTTAATVAYDTALHEGVPAAFRNVPFLDDVENVNAIEKQIALAMRGAREKGEAIAIGHPHPATLEALRKMLPKAKAEGVQLVLVSELVH
jgi:uncharacterized protein